MGGFYDYLQRMGRETARDPMAAAGRGLGMAGAAGAALAYPPAAGMATLGVRGGDIYDWLRQQAMGLGQRAFGGALPPGVGHPALQRGPLPTPGAAPGAPGVPGAPGAPGALPPTPTPAIFQPPQVGEPAGLAAAQRQFLEGGALPGAQTKTEPRSPIRFAWGAGTPQDIQVGTTDILAMEGAPTARPGFMGQAPVAGGMAPGGFGPSQTDWSKVANPLGFEAFREQPAIEEQRRYMEDPLWRERAMAKVEEERQVGVARGVAEAQADIIKQQQEEKLQRYLDIAVAQEQARRRGEGEQPMTPEEIEEYRKIQEQSMLAGAYVGGMGGGGLGMMMP